MILARRSSANSLVNVAFRPLATLLALALVIAPTFFSDASAQTASESLKPAELVVSQQLLGQLVAIGIDGVDRPIASGLKDPRGVTVLRDGTVLIAEQSANQISGLFGPYGPKPAPVATVPRPEAIVQHPSDDLVFVSSWTADNPPTGEIVQVNVVTREVTTISVGYARPFGLAVQGGALYVADAAYVGSEGPGVVFQVNPDGTKTEIASNLGQPVGLAVGPDRSMFVSDYQSGKILRINAEDRVVSDFAEVDGPVYLAIDPIPARANQPWAIAAVGRTGVQEFDSATGEKIGKLYPMRDNLAVGIATTPGGPIPGPGVRGPDATAPVEQNDPAASSTLPPEAGGGSGSGGDADPVTVAERDSGAGGLALAVGVLLLLIGAGVAGFVLFARREGAHFDADLGGFGEIDSGVTLAHAVGPCAAIEARLAEVEQAVRGIQEQRSSVERRRIEAVDLAEEAKEREELARVALAKTQARLAAEAEKHKASGDADEVPDGRVSLDDLNLQTEEGWAALRAFGKKEISAVELRKRWEVLGEKDAIATVLGSGKAMKPEERAAVEELDAAKEQRVHAERDAGEAESDLKRLEERESQAKKQRTEMRKALDECGKEQKKDELQAATEAKEAFAEAEEAATLAALALGAGAFAGDGEDDDGSAAKAERASAKADAKAVKADAKAEAKAERAESRSEKADAKADAKADKVDAKADAKADAKDTRDTSGTETSGTEKPGSGPSPSVLDSGGALDAVANRQGLGTPAAPPTPPLPPPPGPAKPPTGAPLPPPTAAKTEPAKTEPAKTEPVKSEPVKSEPVKSEPAKPPAAAPLPAPPAAAPPAPAGKAAGSVPGSARPGDATPTGPHPPAPPADDPAKAAAQAAAKRAVAKALADAQRAKGVTAPSEVATEGTAGGSATEPSADTPVTMPDELDLPSKRSLFGRKPKR